MLHDRMLSHRTGPLTDEDRRQMARVPFPAELVLIWHHDVNTRIRYRVKDVSDGGFRIRSTTPLFKGTTGTALSLLPEGQTLDVAIMVVWCREDPENGGYEAGLRRF